MITYEKTVSAVILNL